MKTLFLVRHATSLTNAGRHWGDGPASIPLTDEGLAQACTFAANWHLKPDLVVASPYVRSIQTATPLARKFSLPLVTKDVREFTFWDLRYAQCDTQEARRVQVDAFWSRLNPLEKSGSRDAECFVEFIERCRAFRQWVECTPFERCVCLTHGFYMHAFRAIMQGIDMPPKEFMAYLHETLPGRAYANLEVAEYLIVSGHGSAQSWVPRVSDVIYQETLATRIAVVTSAGGSEHSVSLRSAENVCSALCKSFASVQTFPFNAGLKDALLAWQPDVVFPVAHGDGETGVLQTLLDSMNLAYVGSAAASSADCWNKAVANAVVAGRSVHDSMQTLGARHFAVPPFVALRQGDDIRAAVQQFCAGLPSSGAVVVKPAREGSSIGISFCTLPNDKALTETEEISASHSPIGEIRLDRIVQSVDLAFTFDNLVIVQRAIRGIEITVGILETPDAQALPVVEIVTPSGAWYDFEHKYTEGGSQHIIPARLPNAVLKFAQEVAISVHRSMACRDYSRIDFIVDSAHGESDLHTLWFLEVNTLPGFTSTSLFPDSAKAAGYSMPELVKLLVLRAWKRSRPQ